jgi:hypothetical protein
MKKYFYLIVIILLSVYQIHAQNLVSVFSLPYSNVYNFIWGVTQRNDTLWLGSDYDSPPAIPFCKMYKITKTGIIIDSLETPYKFNHGLAWDGTGFWIAEDYRTGGGRIYKINTSGQQVDSIYTNALLRGIGGIALDGMYIWAASYYPDYPSYPYAYAYKISLLTKLIVDSIPLRGKQVQGIAVKGDTIFYVTDNFQGDPERIYAYRKVIGDTLFSFACPDPDNDQDPRGLFWDGQYLWLNAYRVGNNIGQYRNLYKYSITGSGSPQIVTSANAVNFGNVSIGTNSNQPFSISNNGTANLIISAKTFNNARFWITPNNVPDTITPGQNKNYTLTFNPLIFGNDSANLSIYSNDFANSPKIIKLTGKGVYTGAFISLSTTSINFNQRRTGSLCGFEFSVTNQGTSPILISSATTTSQRYRFDTLNLTFPIVIDTQRTKILRVWFNPIAAQTFNDSLTIISNATNLPVARIQLTGQGVNVTSQLGDIYWQGLVPDNPYTSLDDFQPISIKQIEDVNSDGKNDVIVATGNYYVMCFNGNSSVTGDILWTFNTGYNNNNTGSVVWEDGLQIRDDINGDGIKDVVFGCGGGNEMVYTVSGRTGLQIWAWGDSVSYSDGDIEAVRVDKDYNSDGVKDVLVSASGTGSGSGGRHSVICLNGLNGSIIFNVVQPSEFTGDVVCTQFGGAIGNGSNSGAYAVKGFNNSGSEIWSYTVNSKVWTMKEIPTIGTDTVKEIIGNYGFTGNIFCLAANNGSVNWTKSLGSSNNGRIQLLDDLDSNGYIDFTMYGPQAAYRIDSKTNNILWQNNLGSSYLRGVDFLSDVNGDGKRDILISTQQPGKVLVLDGANGNILFTYLWGTSLTQRGDRCATLNSIDGNTTTEFIGGCRDGRIFCFSGGQNIPIGIIPITNLIPEKFSLMQNYPNPFNPVTKIKFDIPTLYKGGRGGVSLKVFDINGREIQTLLNSDLKPGTYEITFDGSNLSSGIYFYRLEAGEFRDVKKMLMIK